MGKAFNSVKTILVVLVISAALVFLLWTSIVDDELERLDEIKMAHAARGFADCVYETGQHNGATRWYLHNNVVGYVREHADLRTYYDAKQLCTEYSDAWYDADRAQMDRFIDWVNWLD